MAVKRNFPYVWVTWVSKLLSGEDFCEWAYWFRSNYEGNSYDKVPSDFDAARWQILHTELVNKTRNEYESSGYKVSVQHQNLLKLKGKSAVLSGIPDLLAVRDDHAVVMDVKTGQPSPTHAIQVMIYMYAVSKANIMSSGTSVSGKVLYQNNEVEVPVQAIDKEFIVRLAGVIRALSEVDPPIKTPSIRECGFCNITLKDCSEKISQNSVETSPYLTDDF